MCKRQQIPEEAGSHVRFAHFLDLFTRRVNDTQGLSCHTRKIVLHVLGLKLWKVKRWGKMTLDWAYLTLFSEELFEKITTKQLL